MALKTCKQCKRVPVIMTSGSVTCVHCGITAVDERRWQTFMARKKKGDFDELIDALKAPVATLQAVCALTDDKGLQKLVAGRLKQLKALDFADYFTKPELAEEFKKKMEVLTRHL